MVRGRSPLAPEPRAYRRTTCVRAWCQSKGRCCSGRHRIQRVTMLAPSPYKHKGGYYGYRFARGRTAAANGDHPKTKHRARARWVGVLISHRSTDRPPSFPLAHLRRRKARRANKPKPTPQPISTPPVPLKTPRHRHPCAREHVHSGRARSVAPRLSSFRRRDSNRCHVIIIFVLASGSRPLSHHCREHRRIGSRK